MPRRKMRRMAAAATLRGSRRNRTDETQSDPMPDVLAPNPRHPGDTGHGIKPVIVGAVGESNAGRTRSATRITEVGVERDAATKGVQRAVKELAEMEKRFKEAVRRQRRAVLESGILGPGQKPNMLGDHDKRTGTQNMKGGTIASKSPRKWTKKRKGENGDAAEPATAVAGVGKTEKNSSLSPAKRRRTAEDEAQHQENDEEEGVDGAEESALPVLVNSTELPFPWRGRLGYACLNTYLRRSNPPVFCSRTCRISSILEHQHPLQDPDKPEHATKNRPDKTKPKDPRLGTEYVRKLGLQNARDLVKLIRWNEKFGIKFTRISSGMFPFASHETYGYSLDFAADALQEAGELVKRWGHRVSMHAGQYARLASPHPRVVETSIRDLEYHDQLLTLMRLPGQQDRDAVMTIHMGGTYGNKGATASRFRENYAKRLGDNTKRRLVLENDGVSWSVHDMLPICEELRIPLVLDWHHHNVVYDAKELRPGSEDIRALVPRILRTWADKGITPEMHYSEPSADAKTPRDMRKHAPRVKTLPPCPPDVDLMIEAKDKEQAVFELMRRFKLDGWERANDILADADGDAAAGRVVADEFGRHGGCAVEEEMNGEMTQFLDVGGKEGRVYWPQGREEVLKVKRSSTRAKKTGGWGKSRVDDRE